MAEIVNAHIIGDHSVAPTSSADETLGRYDKALGAVGHARMHQLGPDFFTWDLPIQAQVSGTSRSLPFTAPWPFRIWSVQMGAEAISAGTLAGDIRVDPVGAGAEASILDAPEAISAGARAVVAPEDGSEDVGFGDIIVFQAVKAGGGTADGCHAKLICQRL